jgi:hypothetical protein
MVVRVSILRTGNIYLMCLIPGFQVLTSKASQLKNVNVRMEKQQNTVIKENKLASQLFLSELNNYLSILGSKLV